MGAESKKQNGDTTTTAALEAMHADIGMREAFEQVEPEAKALAPEDLVLLNTDVAVVTKTVSGCLEKIAPFRPLIVKSLPDFPIETFDKLPAYTQAAMFAHIKVSLADRPAEPVQEIVEEMLPLREILLAEATTATKRGLIDPVLLEGIKGPVGYMNASTDTLFLCELFREKASVLDGKTGVTEAELARGWDLAVRLRAAVGKREQAEAATSQASDTRLRHYTLFVNAYDQVRGAIGYLRRAEGDADKIAPPLYNARKNGKRVEPVEPVAPAAPRDVAHPDNGSAASGNGHAPVVNGNGNGTIGNVTAVQAAPGMPGDEPFHR